MRRAEGSNPERTELGAKARRFIEVVTIAAGLLAPVEASAQSAHGNDTMWAELTGTHVPSEKEILKLETECRRLETRIGAMEAKIAKGGMAYMKDPTLKWAERQKIKDLERELAGNEREVAQLKKQAVKGTERRTEIRERHPKMQLDLSAKHLGSQKIADYYADHGIRFESHRLTFNTAEGLAHLTLGADLTDADFYFSDKDRDLKIVFTETNGTWKTLKLDDGEYAGFYDSDERGIPRPERLK